MNINKSDSNSNHQILSVSTPTSSESIKNEDQIGSEKPEPSLKNNDNDIVEVDQTTTQTDSSSGEKAPPGPTPKDDKLTTTMNETQAAAVEAEESGRERLQRHRVEMAGRVWIPDTWGQEDLLKDWIDCNVFDASSVQNSIMSARAALVQERTTTAANSSVLRIDNSDES